MNATLALEKLNGGEPIPTYELIQAPPDRMPVAGEIRFIMPLIPSPAEPLAQLIPLAPVRIIWTGNEWTEAP